MNIFIDESGNSGDLIKEHIDLDFAEQPIFVLAGIKFNDRLIAELDKKIDNLRKKYKINSSELKSSKLFKNKPEFILELIVELAREKSELFIEVVDKKFYICCSIVNHQIFPPYFTGDESDGSVQLQRNIISDYLARNLTETEYMAFMNSCINLNENTLNASWDALEKFASLKEDEFSKILLKHINETKDDYSILKSENGIENALKNFVPIPDIGKNGKKIHLLPQISCLTNIVARVNHGYDLNEIKFLHDEQRHFDNVILDNVNSMTSLGGVDVPFYYANFNVSSYPLVSFENVSNDNLFIQIADVVSGFMMRYVQKVISNQCLAPVYHEIFYLINILSQISPNTGAGINFVMDRHNLSKLRIKVMSPMIIKDEYSKHVSDIYYDMNLARQENYD